MGGQIPSEGDEGRDYDCRQEQGKWPGGDLTWRNTGPRCDLSFHQWEPGLLGGGQRRGHREQLGM